MTCNYPDLGSDASSVWNFYHCFSDVISPGNQRWHHEMSAVFSGYQATRNQVKCFKPLKQWPTLHVNTCLTPLNLQKLGGKTCHVCTQSDVHFCFACPYLELLFAYSCKAFTCTGLSYLAIRSTVDLLLRVIILLFLTDPWRARHNCFNNDRQR